MIHYAYYAMTLVKFFKYLTSQTKPTICDVIECDNNVTCTSIGVTLSLL